MPRIAQVILALVVGLALLTWAASGMVETAAREWFERDVASRAHLVLTGANHSLRNAWYDPEELDGRLLAIARDERVLAVAAWDPDLTTRSSTSGFPQGFSCLEVGSRIRTDDDNVADPAQRPFREWNTSTSMPTGRVQVSAMPVPGSQKAMGFVVLVQDLSYIDRREAQARTALIIIFALLLMTQLTTSMKSTTVRSVISSATRRRRVGLLRMTARWRRETHAVTRDRESIVSHSEATTISTHLFASPAWAHNPSHRCAITLQQLRQNASHSILCDPYHCGFLGKKFISMVSIPR